MGKVLFFLLQLMPILCLASYVPSDDFVSQERTCEFYENLESEFNCGKRGYPIGFGKKYCRKYERNLHRFSEDGVRWVRKTKSCLINKIIETEVFNSCKDLYKKAFKHHNQCYFESGYCELSQRDREEIIVTIRSSLFNLRVIKEGLKLKKMCIEKKNNF